MRKVFFRGRFIFIPIAIAAFVAFIGFAVMTLWNGVVPLIFHIGTITFWQAVCLFCLCKLLFGFGHFGRKGMGGPWMRHKMEERYKLMTPEEQEKFREKMKQHCGERRGWGHRHPFEGDWSNIAEEGKPTE